MDEDAFLRAISAAPDDVAPRLVYADWLDDRGDPRSEFVRLQVKLRDLSPTAPEYALAWDRERALRPALPAYWLARLDPPVWCVVGNISGRPVLRGEQERCGTPLLRANGKIYLAGYTHPHQWSLLSPEPSRWANLEVVGQHRHSRKWIKSWVAARRTTNWRVQLVHQPGVLVRLREEEWGGFRLRPREFVCPADPHSPDAIRELLEAIDGSFRDGR